MKEEEKQQAEKELESFQKDFDELMKKHPNIMVNVNIRGDLMAYHTVAYNSKICIG